MLKVCLALPVFYPTFAGGPLRFLHYQPGLRKRDIYSRVLAGTPRDKDDFHPTQESDVRRDGPPFESTTLCASPPHPISLGEMFPIDEIDGLPIHRVRLPAATGVRRTSEYFRALIRLCRNPETRPDVIQLHSFERLESIYWLWRLRRLHIPLVYAIQIARPIRQRGRIARWLQKTMRRVFYNRFDGIVTNSSEISDRLRGLGIQTPIAVISNGVDLTRYRSSPDPDQRLRVRRALGVTSAGPIILSVGAICPRKGTDLLIEAWTRLLERDSQAELVLVGPRHDLNNPGLREFHSKIEKLISESRHPERVHMLGVQNEMNDIYAAADLVVLPSSREGMPNAVLEAMACERAVLLTPFLGQTSALGRPGFEFEESNRSPAALAEAIEGLLADPGRRRELIRRGRAWVEETLDVEQSLDQIADFYHRAADRRLRHSPPPSPSNHLLFVTDRKFWRRSIGSEARIAALVLHLARAGFSISVAYLGRLRGDDRRDAADFASSEERVEIIGRTLGQFVFGSAIQSLRDSIRRIVRSRKAMPDPQSAEYAQQGSPARRKFVQRVLRETQPSVVIVEFLRLTYTVYPRPAAPTGSAEHTERDAFEKPPRYWIDTHDAMHQRAERYRSAGQPIPKAITARQETRLLATYDTVLAIQAKEAATFRTLLPDKEVLVVPHGLTTTKRRENRRNRPLLGDSARPIRIGFLGGRDVSNRQSLEWFIKAVWPALRSRFGRGVEFHIAGPVCQHGPFSAPGLICRGVVDSAEHFWNQVDIAINPVQFGSGLKIKNVEALAYGCALATTPIGAEGIEAASPDGLGIATTEVEWTNLLVGWLADPDKLASVARRGCDFADTHLCEDIAFRALRTRLFETMTERAR